MAELVSVIIPTCNRSLLLQKSIKSVLAQSYTDIELLVIDDGSTDNTKEVVEGFEDSRIRYYYQRNKGVSSARNYGILKASGKLIAFLDSDDEWLASKIEKQMEVLGESPDLGMLLCNYTRVDPKGRQIGVTDQRVAFPKDGLILEDVLKAPYLIPPTVLIYKKYLLQVGCFDEKLETAEDMDLFLKLATFVRVGVLEDNLVLITRGNNGLGDSECSYNDHVNVIRKHLSCNNGLDQHVVKKSLYNCYFSFTKGMAIQRNYGQWLCGWGVAFRNVSSISDLVGLLGLAWGLVKRTLYLTCLKVKSINTV